MNVQLITYNCILSHQKILLTSLFNTLLNKLLDFNQPIQFFMNANICLDYLITIQTSPIKNHDFVVVAFPYTFPYPQPPIRLYLRLDHAETEGSSYSYIFHCDINWSKQKRAIEQSTTGSSPEISFQNAGLLIGLWFDELVGWLVGDIRC